MRKNIMSEVVDVLMPLPSGSVALNGWLGSRLRLSIANRLKKVDYAHLVDPFRHRDERDGHWRCEFWGKIVRSAILSWRGNPDSELLQKIKDTVADLLSTQTADGCISSYPYELQTQDWDIWGRKYVLIGLARYYLEIEPSEAVKNAMIRELDYLMTQIGPGKKNIVECGHQSGLAASSILEPVVLCYRITGEKRFLDYALWIAGRGGSTVNNVFTAILDGVPPRLLGNGKAYEMMSCFEGLAELYRETGNPAYKDAVLAFYRAVRDQEIFITGVGGLKDGWGEFWDNGKVKQTQLNVGALGETCVTTTWIKFCGQVLRLTGDATVVDEMERTLYNGVLGAMVPDGSWWMHRNPTPLAGPATKIKAGDQIPGYGEDCCVSQGPKALAMAPWLAVMQDNTGVIINLYEAGIATVPLPDGSSVKLEISGEFPVSDQVAINVLPERAADFTLKLRIPGWSKQTVVMVNGEYMNTVPGTYLQLRHHWQAGDIITLRFDMSIRIIPAFDGSDFIALMRGPVILSQDSRLGSISETFTASQSASGEVVNHQKNMFEICRFADGTTLCDYASAGNEFQENNQLCVWMKKE
jgi:DUF1680 family protein